MKTSMKPIKTKRGALVWGLLGLILSANALFTLPAQARYYPYRDGGGYGFGYHPYVQKALIGGGIGAVAGGLLSRRDPVGAGVKGALLGSAAGLSYEYLRSQNRYGGYNSRFSNGGYSGYSGYPSNSGYRGSGGRGRGNHNGWRKHHHRDWDD